VPILRLWSVLLVLAAPVLAQHNVLLLIADDLGVDRVGAYGVHPAPGHTPNIDALAAGGVLFRNAWATPVCSSTRACILTGQLGMRTGIGRAIAGNNDVELSVDVPTIADVLRPAYRTAACGKWHLHSNPGHPLDHPMLMGFEHYRGNMDVLPGFISDAYSSHVVNTDGHISYSTTYATSETVNDALSFIGWAQEPWLLQVAFHAPHAPFHKPPQSLHTYNLPANIAANIPVHMQAMTEAMDTEIGRLLGSMSPAVLADTYVIFVADNGTDKPAVTPPFDPQRAKNTLYEGGIHVPLIIKGPGVVAGAETAALVNTCDLFATMADMAGAVITPPEDSVSAFPYLANPALPSLRSWVYAEIFWDNGFGPYPRYERTVRNERYKLLRFHVPYDMTKWSRQELYDLQADPFELVDLLATGTPSGPAAQAYAELAARLDRTFAPFVDMGGALPGSQGTPRLVGEGELVAGTPFMLELTSAPASSGGVLLAGVDVLGAPYAGGVIIPDWSSPGQMHRFSTGLQGEARLPGLWPPGIPAGLFVYVQAWVADAATASGLAASNGLRATARAF